MLRLCRLPEYKCSLPGRSQDLNSAIVIDVPRHDLRSNARRIIDQARNPLHPSASSACQLKAIKHRRVCEPVLVVDISMRPPTFAGDDAYTAIAIQVCQRHRMQFRKGNRLVGLFPICPASKRSIRVAHDEMALPRNISLRVSLLLEPGQAGTMRIQAGNHVREAISIDVIEQNICPAAEEEIGFRGAEGSGVKLPKAVSSR